MECWGENKRTLCSKCPSSPFLHRDHSTLFLSASPRCYCFLAEDCHHFSFYNTSPKAVTAFHIAYISCVLAGLQAALYLSPLPVSLLWVALLHYSVNVCFNSGIITLKRPRQSIIREVCIIDIRFSHCSKAIWLTFVDPLIFPQSTSLPTLVNKRTSQLD